MKNKEKVGKSASKQLFSAMKRSHSLSSSAAFQQAYFHVTFREKWIPPLVFAFALFLCLCLSIRNQPPSQGESWSVNWKLSRGNSSASSLSSVFICEYDCHSSHRIMERPISADLFYIPDRLLPPLGLE